MDSRAVVLQGISYPICVVLAKQKAPSGFEPVSTSTPDSAYKYVAELGTALSGDASKRLDLIQLLQAAGIHCPRQASARETATALVSALTSGAVSCYRQKAKTVILVHRKPKNHNHKAAQVVVKRQRKHLQVIAGGQAMPLPVKPQLQSKSVVQTLFQC